MSDIASILNLHAAFSGPSLTLVSFTLFNQTPSHETIKAAADIVVGAEELRYAAQAVGKVSGIIDVEDVLEVVFKDFCIGK